MTTESTTWFAHEGEAKSFWPRLRVLLTALVLCRGVVMLCVLPPFEGWDEYQHVGYVEHVRQTGKAAVLWETTVPTELLNGAMAFPQPSCAVKDQLGRLGGVDYATYWNRNPDPHYFGGSNALYQAQHNALYYRLAAPLFGALGGVSHLRESVGGLRLVNVMLTAAAVWVVLGVLRKVVRREGDAALLGLALAAHPLFLMNGARVANDALGVLLATIAVGAGLSLAVGEGKRVVAHALGVGLLVGFAAMAKATNLGLIPFAAFAWLAIVARGKVSTGKGLVAGFAMAIGCLMIIQADLRFNLAHYGGLTSMQEAVVNHHKGLGRSELLATAETISWKHDLTRLWTRNLFYTGGWSFLPTHPKAARYYANAVSFGLLGWGWVWGTSLLAKRFRRDPVFTSAWVPAACVVLVVSYTLALAYHMVQSKLAWGVSTTNPWYACPALPWFLAVVSAGGLGWPLGKWLRGAIPGALAGAGLAGEAVGVWVWMLPVYAGGATGFEALRRIGTLQSHALGFTTLIAAVCGEIIVVAMIVLTGRDAARRRSMGRPAVPHLEPELVETKV